MKENSNNMWVLPPNVQLMPIAEVSEEIRARLIYDQNDWVIFNSRSRSTAKLISSACASILKEFCQPRTIVNATIRYGLLTGNNPEDLLEEVFPLLEDVAKAGFLVSQQDVEKKNIQASLNPGNKIVDCFIEYCVHLLEDTEVYCIRDKQNNYFALKIERLDTKNIVASQLAREAFILRYLKGTKTPKLKEYGNYNNRSFLIMDWCEGRNAASFTHALRQRSHKSWNGEILEICSKILDAYTLLHQKNVIHGDIHPRNLIISTDGDIKIIDFGYATFKDSESELSKCQRAGVSFYSEPEYARAYISGDVIPQATEKGEQYSLAVLIFYLLTGIHYIDFALENQLCVEQIAHNEPISFTERDLPEWPELEKILRKALSKQPSERFSSVRQFSNEFKSIVNSYPSQKLFKDRLCIEKPIFSSEKLIEKTILQLNLGSDIWQSEIDKASKFSIRNGAPGISYMLYRLACVRDSSSLLSLSSLWCNRAKRDFNKEKAFDILKTDITSDGLERSSLYHSATGIHFIQALIGVAIGNSQDVGESIREFISVASKPCSTLDLHLGKSSVLVGCSILWDLIEDEFLDKEPIRILGSNTLKEIWTAIGESEGISDCNHISYLGIAHGWAGVLYATMLWCHTSKSDLPISVEQKLFELISLARPHPLSGGCDWGQSTKPKISINQAGWPGWCHGTAGFVYLWLLSYKMFNNEKFLEMAIKAGLHTRTHERTINNLCCGLTGQAYALLSLYKHTQEVQWLQSARAIGERSIANMASHLAMPYSLYKGHLGIILLAADLEKPSESCFPLFEMFDWN